MGAKGFILTLLLLALAGAGAGYGAAQLVPADEEEQAPVTSDLVAPGAGGTAAEAGAATGRARQTGREPTADDVIAAMPPEMRQELENNPEAAAMARAQIQMALDSGQIPLEAFGLTPGGAPGAGADPGTQDAGARNAEPLAGTVVSFEGGTLRLETPDGEAAVAVPDDAPVNVTKAVADSQSYLAEGAEVSVIARPDDSGSPAAAAIVVGAAGQGTGGGRGFGGVASVVMGTVTSFGDGVLTLEDGGGRGGVRRGGRCAGAYHNDGRGGSERVVGGRERHGVRAARGGRQPVGGERARRGRRRLRRRAVRRRPGHRTSARQRRRIRWVRRSTAPAG